MSRHVASRVLARAARSQTTTFPPRSIRQYAVAAAVPTSSSIPSAHSPQIQHEKTVPNPDPAPDSPTSAFLNQSTPYMVPTYVRPPPMMVSGSGCTLYDNENHAYLDFTAGIAVNSLGHADPALTRIIENQANTLIHASNLYHNPWTPTLSKLLVEETAKQSPTSSQLTQVFISNSGSEANEAASNSPGKSPTPEIPTALNGKSTFRPMLPGFRYGTFNDTSALDSLITRDTAGVIIEPIQGEGGINVATPEFLQALRKRCDEVNAVLIFDEIQCGLSRTGDLWAHTASGVQPDILTTAKALGNGIPIGATLVHGTTVAPHIKTGDHGTTFGGNPLACRVAHHIFTRLSDPALQEEVRIKSTLFLSAFETMKLKYPDVLSEVRGRGLIVGYQLTDSAKAKARDGVLRIVPPLVISAEEINRGLDILDQAMAVVFKTEQDVGETRGQQEMAR
ncbi:Acetylornithine aminotransferase, mitochondrial [Cyphellophora attinorum]|uniref:Acetylornithine aminotransferase, mitochondrial n=1 Tax=Cyphellophora attinorum TaxID=1664694 RepID=A0A0N0NHV9_9EURO|nr:Acetylornithine aminotransferase, mitochondrial [Phialophora attinorum]KPI34729.1 Acetylornithine aminotransferase, mitochondrial [Phialophora attinorum]